MLRRTLVGTFFTIVVLLTTSSASPRLSAANRVLPPHVEGEVLIQFRPGATRLATDRVLARLGAREASRVGRSTTRRVRLSGMDVREALERYAGHPDVAYVEPNYLISTAALPNDQNFAAQWHLLNTGQSGGTPGADISAIAAWDISTDAPNVLTAIIDSGISLTHPDLLANVFVNPGEIPNNGVDDDHNGYVDDVYGWDFLENDNDPTDANGHGTHVAGTVGAIGNNGIGVSGVAWNTKLLPCRFLGPTGTGDVAGATGCVDYAVQMGADIINASWSGGEAITLREAVERSYEAGVLFVAAAGNSSGGNNNDVLPVYPASYGFPNIIAVAATNHDDQLWPNSHFGRNSVDIAAPGDTILSTWPTGYAFLSGTSMATPQVAGVAALIKERRPELDAVALRQLILDGSDRLPNLQGIVGSGGRLNAVRPLEGHDQVPPGMIDDLETLAPDATRIDLTWTAGGDDGDMGQADRYEVRYDTALITEEVFASATLVPNPPRPAEAGSTERLTVRGLAPDTAYYFALKVFDEFNNVSPISNSAMGITTGPPRASVTPEQLEQQLITGQSQARTLTLRNDGDGEYTFGAGPERVEPEARRPVVPPEDLGDGVDVKPLAPPTDGFSVLIVESGTGVDEIRDELATFLDLDVVDVLSARSDVPSLEQLQAYDSVIVVVNLPFDDALAMGDLLADYVDGGGGLVLTLASFLSGLQFEGRFLAEGYYPFNIGTGTVAGSTLGAFDPTHPIMNGVTAASAGFLGNASVAPGADLIASWANGQPLVATRRGTVAALNVYVGGTGSWGGDIGLMLHNTARWSGNVVSWIRIEPETGVVPAGETLDVQVTFDAKSLIGGGYDSNIVFRGDDPANPILTVPVHLDVIGAPDLATTPATLDFGELFVGDTVERTLAVHNIGSERLTVTGITTDHPDFLTDDSSFTLSPGGSSEVTVTFTPTIDALIETTLTLSSDDPDEPEFAVPMRGHGLVPPDIAVSPTNLFDTLVSGETATQTLFVTNDGGSDLVFQLEREEPAGANPPFFELREDFEDGDFDGWGEVTSSNLKEVTDATAADGTAYSYHQTNRQTGHFNGIFYDLPSIEPEYVGFWVRSASTGKNDAYFLLTGANRFEAIFFYATGNGRFFVNGNVGGNTLVEYEANAWYFIEFRDIDFVEREFDYYVDSALVQENVPFRNPAEIFAFLRVDLYNHEDGGEAWWDQIVISDDPLAQAIRLDPKRGVVPAGGTVEIEVTFDSRGLLAGDHPTNILIGSNDPDEPVVVVPTLLTVIGAPDIDFPEGVPDFGDVFLGTTSTLELRIANKGTDTLEVASATFDHPSFAVEPATFAVAPGDALTLTLAFTATELGSIDATLTLLSNDANQNPLTLPFSAAAVEPPVIDVEPAAIDDELFTGQVRTHSVTLTNSGGTELVFDIETEVLGQSATGGASSAPVDHGMASGGADVFFTHPPRTDTHLPPGVPPPVAGFTPAGEFAFYDGFEDGDFDGWGLQDGDGTKEVTDETAANGTRYSYHESNAPGGHLTGIFQPLDGAQPSYVGFWIRSPDPQTADSYVVLRDPGGRTAIFFFANDVGKLYVNGDVGGNALIDYTPGVWVEIEFKNIDFERQFFDYWVDGELIQERVPFRNAGSIDSFQQVDLYNHDEGAEGFWDEIVIADFEPIERIEVAPLAGAVAPGESVNLAIRLDALRAESGVSEFVVHVNNNDPFRPDAAIPVTMRAIGSPDVELPRTTLEFGTQFVGTSTPRSLVVGNNGPLTLVVDEISTDDPTFTVSPSAVTVEPFGERQVEVIFGPSSPGDHAASLILHSNDPDEEDVVVSLSGTAEDPPNIEVIPASFTEQLLSEELRTETMRIANTGATELSWSIFFEGLQPGWLRVAPRGGTLAAGGAADVELTFNVGPLAPGAYDIGLRVESNDPDEPLVLVPVVLLVAAAPVIAVSPDPLEFENAFVGMTVTATLQIANRGDAPLVVSDIVADDPRFSVPDPTLTVAPDTAQGVEINFTADSFDAVEATLTITSNDPFRPTVNVAMQAAGEMPPNIVVTPTSLAETMSSFEVLMRQLTISNTAGGELEFEIEVTGRGPFDRDPPANGTGDTESDGATDGDGSGDAQSESVRPPDWLAPMATLGPVPMNVGGGPRQLPGRDVIAKGGSGDRLVFGDDFEDGEFLDTWILNPSLSSRGISQLEAADFSTKSFREFRSQEGHLTGIHQELPGLRPSYIGFWVRSNSVTTNDGYFVLRDSNLNEAIFFFLSEVGRIYCNATIGGDFTARYVKDRWVFIEFKNIDFERQRFDYYVNYQRFREGVPFLNFGAIDGFSRIDLYNFSEGADAYWDQIVFATEAPFDGLRVRPFEGAIEAGGGQFVNVFFDTRNLIDGLYEAEIHVHSNDPDTPEIVIPATIDHIGMVNISVGPRELDFGEVLIGLPKLDRVTIINQGTATLEGSSVVIDHPHFTPSVDSFVLGAHESMGLEVLYDPPEPESVEAVMTIRSNDPDTPVIDVRLLATAVIPARIDVDPGSVEESLYTGQTSTRTIEITNPGGLDLLFDVDLRTPTGIPIPRQSLLFEDDMEGDGGGWATQVYSQDDLWHRSERVANSPATAWWCGDEATGNYATSDAISTALVSPPIDLREMEAPIRVSFWENHITEPGHDQCMVDLSLDDGQTWIPLRGAYGSAPSGDSRGWHKRLLNLNAYSGEIVRVRFFFETRDTVNNGFPGWFVDDMRVTALGSPYLSATPLSGTVASGELQEIILTFDAFEFRPAGAYEALVKIESNDPFLPLTEIPATLTVNDPGRLVLLGELVTLESVLEAAAGTSHGFPIVFPPSGAGSLTVIAEGDYDETDEMVTVTVEPFVAGALGGSGATCAPVEGDFTIPAQSLRHAAADGLVEVTLRDSAAVDSTECESAVQTVRLAYTKPLEQIDFGEVRVGESSERTLELANVGAGVLHVTSISSAHPDVVIGTHESTLLPNSSTTVALTWTPAAEGLLGGTLFIESDDPFGTQTSVDLDGLAEGSPPRAEVSPSSLQAALPPHSDRTKTRTIFIANSGEGDLTWTASAPETAAVMPAAGTVPPGGEAPITVTLDAVARDEGVYRGDVTLTSNDPDNPRIDVPVTLHVRDVELGMMKLDFTPKYAERPGTVEVYMQLPPGYDVEAVDLVTVDLNGVQPDPSPLVFRDSNRDGVPELILQFDLDQLDATIPSDDTVEVRLGGEVRDRTWFHGSQYVRGRVIVDPPE